MVPTQSVLGHVFEEMSGDVASENRKGLEDVQSPFISSPIAGMVSIYSPGTSHYVLCTASIDNVCVCSAASAC